MKINIRENKPLLGTIIAAIILLAYFYVVEPIIESQQRIATELTANTSAANQNQLRISRKEKLEQKLIQSKQEFNQLDAGLLPGDKAPLAAVELQKIIKAIVKKYRGVKIISEKVLEPIELGAYQRIAVQVTLSCLVSKLEKIVYHIENNETMLSIPQISIKIANPRRPKDVRATMVIEGAISLGESNV